MFNNTTPTIQLRPVNLSLQHSAGIRYDSLYFLFIAGTKSVQTDLKTVFEDTSSPAWSESYELNILNQVIIQVELWQKRFDQVDAFIGNGYVNISEFLFNGPLAWVDLRINYQFVGKIQLEGYGIQQQLTETKMPEAQVANTRSIREVNLLDLSGFSSNKVRTPKPSSQKKFAEKVRSKEYAMELDELLGHDRKSSSPSSTSQEKEVEVILDKGMPSQANKFTISEYGIKTGTEIKQLLDKFTADSLAYDSSAKLADKFGLVSQVPYTKFEAISSPIDIRTEVPIVQVALIEDNKSSSMIKTEFQPPVDQYESSSRAKSSSTATQYSGGIPSSSKSYWEGPVNFEIKNKTKPERLDMVNKETIPETFEYLLEATDSPIHYVRNSVSDKRSGRLMDYSEPKDKCIDLQPVQTCDICRGNCSVNSSAHKKREIFDTAPLKQSGHRLSGLALAENIIFGRNSSERMSSGSSSKKIFERKNEYLSKEFSQGVRNSIKELKEHARPGVIYLE